ncbi:MAG: alpha/beta fold hydrolase [Chrysiogenales bacterium]
MKKILASIIILVLSGFCITAAVNNFATYKEMRQYLGQLINEKKFALAEEVLQAAVKQFPDRLLANSFNLAYVRVQLKKYKGAVKALAAANQQGIFFGIWDFTQPEFAPLKPLRSFQAFEKRNNELLAAAQEQARIELEVITPEGFDAAKKYPLFLALHGGGETLKDFKPQWWSLRLKNEFIVAFVQSSQVAGMNGFHWQDAARTQKDLADAFGQVCAAYPVDPQRVIIGGFSSGGFASLAMSMKNGLPVSGFIALCPEVPEGIRDEDIRQAVSLGVRGTILSTAMDNRLDRQRQLADRFRNLGLQYQFMVTPDIGHWYPENLDKLIDQAIAHIFNR